MSAPKNEQDEAVDWDYDKMTNGMNVKFPPLDSGDVPHVYLGQYHLKQFRNVWNEHSRHWDVQSKIEIFDYLWSPSVTENHAWDAISHPLYSERSKFSAYVILKWFYPDDCNLPLHRFIRWGKYPAIDWDEHQATDWGGNPVTYWDTSESPAARGYQCSGDDVETFNEGVRNSVQDEPDESLKTKNTVIVHGPWWNTKDAPLSPALDQQNNNNADGPSEEVVRPGTWIPSRPSPDPLGEDDQHYQRQERSEWGSNDEKCAWGLSAANRTYAASDLESVRSKGMTLQETSAEDDGVYSGWGNPYRPKRSGRRARRGRNAFASKFSSETEGSDVGVITPASSNVEQIPALSSQQIQELKDFITKTNNDSVAQLSLEMSHMKTSLEEKIERMREDFNLRLNRAMKVNRSLRDDMESLQLSLPDDATTRQQVRELEAKVANLEQSYPTF
ncbi:uncharacterized protein B0J16DRAFT_394684 [Fusarium flagelliforme]|uniref:Uncharacterized protein n=1 Tax=Fusarium flagelliforme TaxID=2675880 RepID=A0A395MY12_9HYPO|nr:uncharacterized protein B0J16DRAFT_394684 [Fusarium flagelliforme]KAH7192694.1 hypothetical protein B0J16DRAFT_394684 [Fusarium flagelliforme]RFN52535.1 hypothetical protein FIE12Z_3296 [Fusarium flagelliforme]